MREANTETVMGFSIIRVERNRAVKRRVRLGLSTGDFIELLDEDLEPGHKIVTVGVEDLNDGDRIKAVEPVTGPSPPTEAD